MLSRILVAGILAGGLSGATLLGQTTPVPFDWATLAGGALGSSPAAIVLAWRLSKADKDNVAMRDELRALNVADRLLTERIATVLAEASRALLGAQEGMEATLNRDRPSADIERVVRRLEDIVRDAGEDPNRRGGPR